MTSTQLGKPEHYADVKVSRGRIAVAQFSKDGKDLTRVTYFGNDGVFEQALYESTPGGLDLRLVDAQTGRHRPERVVMKYAGPKEGFDGGWTTFNLRATPRIRENAPEVVNVLEDFRGMPRGTLR